MQNLKDKILAYATMAAFSGVVGVLAWPREVKENDLVSYKASKLQEVKVRQYEAELNDEPNLHIVYIDEAPFGDVDWVWRKNRFRGKWEENGLMFRPSQEDIDNFNRLKVELSKQAYPKYDVNSWMWDGGKSSFETLSDWQVERRKEFIERNYNFANCDKDDDATLNVAELDEYLKSTSFDSRFR